MTDLSQMLRWNAGFVRGLAQSVLERARLIRSTLSPVAAEAVVKSAKPKAKKTRVKKKAMRKTKRAHA